jgi:hypothetical protein
VLLAKLREKAKRPSWKRNNSRSSSFSVRGVAGDPFSEGDLLVSLLFYFLFLAICFGEQLGEAHYPKIAIRYGMEGRTRLVDVARPERNSGQVEHKALG